jgi:hypothetical protein
MNSDFRGRARELSFASGEMDDAKRLTRRNQYCHV